MSGGISLEMDKMCLGDFLDYLAGILPPEIIPKDAAGQPHIPEDIWNSATVTDLKKNWFKSDEFDSELIEEIGKEVIRQLFGQNSWRITSDTSQHNGSIKTNAIIEDQKDHRTYDGDGEYNEYEQSCRSAMYSELVHRIAERPRVQAFRQHLPGGTLLTEDAAWDFITSPLVSYFTFSRLEEANVCPFTSEASILSTSSETLHCSSSGTGEAGFFAREPNSFAGYISQYNTFTLLMTTRDGEAIQETAKHYVEDFTALVYDSRIGTSRVYDMSKVLPVPLPPSLPSPLDQSRFRQSRAIRAYRKSIVGEALSISEEISTLFSWDVKDALLFLLTGILTDQSSLFALRHLVAFSDDATVMGWGYPSIRTEKVVWGPAVIVVQPWVTPEALASFYKRLYWYDGAASRPQAKNERVSNKQQVRHRRLSKKEADFFLEVNEIRRVCNQSDPKTPWRTLCALWKQAGTGRDQMQVSNFHRDYHAVLNKLFRPMKREE